MKQVIKKLGSKVYSLFQLYKRSNFNTKIIAYHQVNPDYFEEQITFLKNNFQVSSLSQALQNLDKKQVVITFDDGYKNNLDVAYPVLKKSGLKATVYVPFNFIDNNEFAWWDKLENENLYHLAESLKSLHPSQLNKKVTELTKNKEKPEKYNFMTWSDLKKIEDVFEIGGHTITHPILTNISMDEARKEIVNSKVRLEEKLGHPIVSFSYPNGNYNQSLMNIVEESGFNNALTYKKGNNISSTNKYALLRRGINYNDNLDIFKAKIGGLF